MSHRSTAPPSCPYSPTSTPQDQAKSQFFSPVSTRPVPQPSSDGDLFSPSFLGDALLPDKAARVSSLASVCGKEGLRSHFSKSWRRLTPRPGVVSCLVVWTPFCGVEISVGQDLPCARSAHCWKWVTHTLGGPLSLTFSYQSVSLFKSEKVCWVLCCLLFSFRGAPLSRPSNQRAVSLTDVCSASV